MNNIRQAGRLTLNLMTNMLDVQIFEKSTVPLDRQEHRLLDLILEARAQVELFYHYL